MLWMFQTSKKHPKNIQKHLKNIWKTSENIKKNLNQKSSQKILKNVQKTSKKNQKRSQNIWKTSEKDPEKNYGMFLGCLYPFLYSIYVPSYIIIFFAILCGIEIFWCEEIANIVLIVNDIILQVFFLLSYFLFAGRFCILIA